MRESADINKRPLRPAMTVPQDIDAPRPVVSTAANGIKIYTLDCSSQDVVRVSFVFRAGTALQVIPFSASATANMLSEGSLSHSAQEIAEKLDFYGSFFEAALDRDYSVITFVALSRYFEETLGVAREILLEPAFHEHELETYASKRKQRLAVERSKVAFKARELFASTLFGPGHPYGVSYHQDMYDGLTPAVLREFYSRRYTADNCFVVCSGKVGEHEKNLIELLAASIPGGGDIVVPQYPAVNPGRLAFESHEGALQSAIRVGLPLFPRTHPDYIAMQVAATVLGGYFGSRLVHNLREERGYTYGVFAAMANLEQAGYMGIGTEVATEVTADALRQIFYETGRMREELVPIGELDMVRNIMTGEVMRILDGPFGIADVTIENIQNGADNSYLENVLDEIRTITPQRVRDVAREYLDPAAFTTAVVGDSSISAEVEDEAARRL